METVVYLEPQVTVVEFAVESGFATSTPIEGINSKIVGMRNYGPY